MIEIYLKDYLDGNHLGIKITYKIKHKAEGLAQVYWKEFIGSSNVALILGDNYFMGKR